MKRLNPFSVYRFGGALKFFDRLKPDTRFADIQGFDDFSTDCCVAHSWLNWLLENKEIQVVDCRKEAVWLKQFLESTSNFKPDELLGADRHHIITYRFGQFETQLETELAKMDIYYVTKVNAYDTDTLLSKGRASLPERIAKAMDSDSVKCFEEGTRCLALKLATSAGFQFLRSVEGVMHQFYDVLSGGTPRPKRREMGGYIDALEKLNTVDPRMTDVLRGIKNLRRNPLMHPEDFLDMDDAQITFDVAKSAISTMAVLAEEHTNSKP